MASWHTCTHPATCIDGNDLPARLNGLRDAVPLHDYRWDASMAASSRCIAKTMRAGRLSGTRVKPNGR